MHKNACGGTLSESPAAFRYPYLCFIGLCALYTVIHCVAGSPNRTFFLGAALSSKSSASRPRLLPTWTSSYDYREQRAASSVSIRHMVHSKDALASTPVSESHYIVKYSALSSSQCSLNIHMMFHASAIVAHQAVQQPRWVAVLPTVHNKD
jgi:hypothetical protein